MNHFWYCCRTCNSNVKFLKVAIDIVNSSVHCPSTICSLFHLAFLSHVSLLSDLCINTYSLLLQLSSLSKVKWSSLLHNVLDEH